MRFQVQGAAVVLLAALAACSGSTPSGENATAEEQNAADTDRCLDNPELARTWGDCNVKHTLYLRSEELAKCRKLAPGQKGVAHLILEVRANGSVKSAKASGDGNAKLRGCLSRVMRKLRFAPPPNGKASIDIPYQLGE